MKYILLLPLLAISCRPAHKPVMRMMEVSAVRPHLVFKEMEDSCKPYKRIVDGVVVDTIYPCSPRGYSYVRWGDAGHFIHPVEDTMTPSPEAAARIAKWMNQQLKPKRLKAIKPKYFINGDSIGYGRVCCHITWDAQGRITTLSNHYHIPHLW